MLKLHRNIVDHDRLWFTPDASASLAPGKTAVELLPFLKPFIVHAELKRRFRVDQLQVHLAVIGLLPFDVGVLENRLAVIAKDLANEGAIALFVISMSHPAQWTRCLVLEH